jgi:hypothetical protein
MTEPGEYDVLSGLASTEVLLTKKTRHSAGASECESFIPRANRRTRACHNQPMKLATSEGCFGAGGGTLAANLASTATANP